MASTKTRRHLDPARIHRRCESQKLCYVTKSEALDAAEMQMLRGAVRVGCHVVPFQCERCAYWHLRNKVLIRIGPYDPDVFKGEPNVK